jgi:hypothetical protein
MDGYLSNKPDNFVDDPEKLYRLRAGICRSKSGGREIVGVSNRITTSKP